MDPKSPQRRSIARRRAAVSRAAVRATVSGLSAVAPPAGVELAAHLMARVGAPARVRPQDRAVHDRARRGALALRGERVATYQWGDDDAPAVLLAHGWQLRASRMAALATAVEAAGLRALAFDALAHGESSGRRTNVFELAEILRTLADDVVARGGEVAGVVGHSLGGLAAGIAVRDGLPAPRWVAIGAPASVESTGMAFARMVGLPQPLWPELYRAAARRFLPGDPAAWARADLVALPAPSGSEALFVRDVDDAIGLPGDGRRLHAAHPGSALLVTGGLGHNRILDDPGVCAAVVAHVSRARVPS